MEAESPTVREKSSRGCVFYVILMAGLVALGLILVSIYLPAQLVFETKPFARLVLSSGQMDSWRADQLGLDAEDYQLVQDHYQEYLRRYKQGRPGEGSSSSSDEGEDSSSSSDSDEHSPVKAIRPVPNNKEDDDDDDDDDDHGHRELVRRAIEDDDLFDDDDDDDHDDTNDNKPARQGNDGYDDEVDKDDTANVAASSSMSSSDAENGVDSDPYEDVPLEELLIDQPLKQTIGLGLFKGRRCVILQNFREKCETILVQSGLNYMREEVTFMDNDINMSMWNNMRVEAIFTAVGCAIGLICLFATQRPCCDNKRIPVNLGALAFAGAGLLIYVPIIRLMLIRGDFEQNLATDINITTTVKFSWSLLISGCASPFALLAAFLLVGNTWVKETRKLYRKLLTTRKDNKGPEKAYEVNRNEEMVRMVSVSTDEASPRDA